MISLRDYQQIWVERLQHAWLSHTAVLGVCPTGGGKTRSFAAIIRQHKGASAAVVHRKEIVGQISEALADLEVKHRVVAPPAVVRRIRRRHLKLYGKCFVDPQSQCGVVSVQTLTSKGADRNDQLQRWVNQVTLAVFDEGHHYVKTGLWAKAVELLSRGQQLFVTACPERADGKGLGVESDGFAEVMVEGPTLPWLTDQGFLSRFTYKAPATDLDLSDIPLTASGEVNTKAMRSRVVDSHLVGDVVDQYRLYLAGKRVIVFANDVATAQEMEAEFLAAGIPAKQLNGSTDAKERDDALDDFNDGKTLVLINVDLFDEGFDVPGADGVIIARITMSLNKFLQMVGRVLRVVYAKGHDLSTAEGRLAAIAAGPKPRAIVIDPVRNWERHGMPNWPRKWSLGGREGGGGGSRAGLPRQRVCTGCTQPYEMFHKVCPYCSTEFVPAGRSSPEQVCGDLVDLDPEVLAQMLARMQKADMSDDDYKADQWARRIPAVGRPADLKRHRQAKAARAVLQELVGWWWGCQPDGRDDREKQRRFFLRFGVDVVTAMSLKQKETEALIDLIKTNFQEDMT